MTSTPHIAEVLAGFFRSPMMARKLECTSASDSLISLLKVQMRKISLQSGCSATGLIKHGAVAQGSQDMAKPQHKSRLSASEQSRWNGHTIPKDAERQQSLPLPTESLYILQITSSLSLIHSASSVQGVAFVSLIYPTSRPTNQRTSDPFSNLLW